MASRRQKSAPAAAAPGTTLGAAPPPPPPIGDNARLIGALDRFCTENSHFESTVMGDLIRGEMAAAADINEAALVPIRHSVFGFEAALKWGFFLLHAVPKLRAEDAASSRAPPFDVAKFYAGLPDIYDIAAEAAVWEYCEDDDEDEDDDEADEAEP